MIEVTGKRKLDLQYHTIPLLTISNLGGGAERDYGAAEAERGRIACSLLVPFAVRNVYTDAKEQKATYVRKVVRMLVETFPVETSSTASQLPSFWELQ